MYYLRFILLSLICIIFISFQLFAQYAVTPDWISPDARFTMSVALADLDKDGYLDFVEGNYKYPYNFTASPDELGDDEIGDHLYAYRWDYNSTNFMTATRLTAIATPRCIDCIALADYDHDTDIDIAIGCVVGKGNDGGVWVFKNQYDDHSPPPFNELFFDDLLQGQFHNDHVWRSTESYDAHCVRWVDYNCDGHLDLAALDVHGILHLYAGNGTSESELITEDPIYLFDDLTSDSFYGLSKKCTTMEFGDIDGDGDLDLLVDQQSKPYIYLNQWVQTGGPTPFIIDEQYRLDIPSDVEEVCSCASFGWYNDPINPDNNQIALAVGSMSVTGNVDRPANYGWGNDLYIIDDPFIPSNLVHIAKSEISLTILPQLVTDIKWGFIDGANDTDMDIVAVSYANIAYNDQILGYEWQRGYEQIHSDINTDIGVGDDLPTNVWTSTGGYNDLSTSLALGDIDGQGLSTNHYEDFDCQYEDDLKNILYLLKFPFYEITDVVFDDDDDFSSPFTNPPYQLPDYSYNYEDGWISIDRTQLGILAGTSNIYVRVYYSYSTQLDLAVGNDGKNVVYFNSGSGGTSPQDPGLPIAGAALTLFNNYSDPLYDPHAYDEDQYPFDPDPAVTQEHNLMAKDGLGAGASDIPKLPNCQMFAVTGWWNQMEIFKGHYFWDNLDKTLDAIQNDGNENKATINTSDTPIWTIGNYSFANVNPNETEPWAEDHRYRTSDERLHTMFARNLVNRYRPGGVISTCNDINQYFWGTNWGATFFQFEFEASYAGGPSVS